jgi:hypothetical protein
MIPDSGLRIAQSDAILVLVMALLLRLYSPLETFKLILAGRNRWHAVLLFSR